MVASVSLLDRTTPASSSHSNGIRADAVSVAALSTASNTIGTASRSRTLQPVSSTRTLELAAASEQAQTKAIARFLVIAPPQNCPGEPLRSTPEAGCILRPRAAEDKGANRNGPRLNCIPGQADYQSAAGCQPALHFAAILRGALRLRYRSRNLFRAARSQT